MPAETLFYIQLGILYNTEYLIKWMRRKYCVLKLG